MELLIHRHRRSRLWIEALGDEKWKKESLAVYID